MITGEGNAERVKYAIDAGVNNYIIKPLSVQILQQKLMQTMKVSSELKVANSRWQDF